MCTAANVYVNITYKPAFCPFLLCTRNLGRIQQRAKCAKWKSLWWQLLQHLPVQNIRLQKYGIFTGTFQVIFLKWFSTMFPSIIGIWQPRDKKSNQLQFSISLSICLCPTLCTGIWFLKAKWPMNIFATCRVGYEMALLGAGWPPLPGCNTRGQYTAPPNRWSVQWQQMKIV